MSLARRDSIVALQDHMLAHPEYAEPEVSIKHSFAAGIYAREMTLKAGSFVVGALHKTQHLFNVSQGSCIVATDNKVELIEAPYSGRTEIGDKRVITAITDLIWTTYHVTEETDIEVIEESITAKDYRELLE